MGPALVVRLWHVRHTVAGAAELQVAVFGASSAGRADQHDRRALVQHLVDQLLVACDLRTMSRKALTAVLIRGLFALRPRAVR